MPTVDDLRASRDLSVGLLRTIPDPEWSTSIPDLDITVREMCAHFSQACFWYSIDLTARGEDLTSVVPEVNSDSAPADLVTSVHVGAELLASVVTTSPADARGFHPFGQADPSGFAAMACDELLVHTWDIAGGLGLEFQPPADIAGRVLARLFPWVAGDEDPWTLLLWANGRVALSGRPRQDKWKWHCAPLTEWDDLAPVIVS